MERMKRLITLLNEASKAYYQEDREIISNYEYDLLYDELAALEKQNKIVFSQSPTLKVGYPVLSNLQKVRHDNKILSLDKTKELEKLKTFLGSEEGILSFKLDGLTIVLTYENGRLIRAVTRGNGEIGEDVTHNAYMFQNVPIEIRCLENIAVRGEAVISYSEFSKINGQLDGKEQYKNTRNLVSGTVRQLDSTICAKRNVTFIAFGMQSASWPIAPYETGDLKSLQLRFLSDLGFTVVEHKIVNSDTVGEAVFYYKNRIAQMDFASDGLVLTYNSLSYSEAQGVTSKFPKDALAFKWTDETAQTVLTHMLWNTSRTGLINPVAVFEPVELEGTTVKQASVHNVSVLEDLELGIGDTITVYKANMIIPQVAENLTRSGHSPIPSQCPVCGFETEIRKLREGKALYCTNPNCRAQLIRFLAHFSGRNAMNIEGLSQETIKKFVHSHFIENYTDIYFLSRYENEIKNMEGFGEKSYMNLMSSIEKSKLVGMENFIFALGVNQVGLAGAKLLCRHFQYDFTRIRKADADQLTAIEGFGDITAQSLTRYFADEKNNSLLDKILNIITFQAAYENKSPLTLAGKTFVITGDVFRFKNRNELKEKIESLGGKVAGSVSAKTNYLINNDFASLSNKNKKATELNVPIISENDFLKMI